MRGSYTNKNRGRQLILFDGMRWRNITPTDIDMAIEFCNKTWVLCEIKHRKARLPVGQRIFMERFVNDITRSGKTAIAIVAEHEVDDCNEDVYAKDTNVREIYSSFNPSWHRLKTTHKLDETVDVWIQKHG